MEQVVRTTASPIQPSRSKTPFIVIIAVLLTALLVGGAVYAWQQQMRAKEKEELVKQVANIQQQIDTLRTATPSPVSQLPAADIASPIGTPTGVVISPNSPICTDPIMEDRAIGGYNEFNHPVAPQYKHLTYLGQILTASKCGPERLRQAAGANSDMFTKGLTIWLEKPASSQLLSTLQAIQFACDDVSSGTSCLIWKNDDFIPIQNLLKLEPFISELKQDDCIACG